MVECQLFMRSHQVNGRRVGVKNRAESRFKMSLLRQFRLHARPHREIHQPPSESGEGGLPAYFFTNNASDAV
jgi:hypothetical protein